MLKDRGRVPTLYNLSFTFNSPMRLHKIVLCTALIICSLPAFPQNPTLSQRIEQIMARPEFRHALFGIKFYSLDTGKTLYELNADKLFKPA